MTLKSNLINILITDIKTGLSMTVIRYEELYDASNN